MIPAQIDLGWMHYGDGHYQHRWVYDWHLQLLRSRCHAIWRSGEIGCLLLDDRPGYPKCQRCLKDESHVVD